MRKISRNQLAEMKADILNSRQRLSGSILNSGWKRIPAIHEFTLETGKTNKLLKECGLERKTKSTIDVSKSKSNRMNRYIGHQLRRLNKANSVDYGKLADLTIRKSISFRISAVNRVIPDGGHRLTLSEIFLILRKVDAIVNSGNADTVIKRVYIEKANGKKRPLGVPTIPGRMVMHMGANMITYFVKGKIDFNHAYQPGRGCLTAGKEVINKVLKSKYIYEFDLSSFFDNVPIEKVSHQLLDLGMPLDYVGYLSHINSNTINLEEKDEVDESNWRERDVFQDIFQESLIANGCYVGAQMGAPEYEDWDDEDPVGQLLSSYLTGLPQGLNTSPILSVICLREGAQQLQDEGINLIMYADDGIMYSDKPFIPFSPDFVDINVEKSGGIRNDEIDRPFKFLGLEYHNGRLSGSTRKGSTLSFEPKQERLFDLLKDLQLEYPDKLEGKTDLERLSNSSLFGLVQSKLYQGTWEDPDIERKNGANKGYSGGDVVQQPNFSVKGHPLISSEANDFLAQAFKLLKPLTPIIRR